ncbi:hypothetical protein [Curtobacterium flaccumfaciens]|uniref:hypothetical protein n=1 Tax=Curtobacterium flaccumfaciens TaxID=2035 RepID=UPI001E4001DE|nr:hypothetical protein [Curtobacterium allii]MCE0459523.1 hypothetical protein [Curtobacterium allii]
MEQPTKGVDGSWSGDAELVNMDRVTSISVSVDQLNGQAFTLLHLEGERGRIGRYYFGVGSLTSTQKHDRLTKLQVALNSGSPIGWSMVKDMQALNNGQNLPDIAS